MNPVVRALLGHNDPMRKYQNGKLETRIVGGRKQYFIRFTKAVPSLKEKTGFRKIRDRHVIGWADQMPRKEAVQERARFLDGINSGRTRFSSYINFAALVDQYREARLAQLKASTRADYESQLSNHILPAFGEMRLAEIDRPKIEAWLASKKDMAWWSRRGMKKVLSAVFTAAKEWGILAGDNPTNGIRLGGKHEKREKRLLTAEQLQLILAGVSTDTRLMILTAVVTGLRISEVLGLQWNDIDVPAATLTVQRRWYRGDLDEPKTEASKRTRQIGPLALELCRRVHGSSPFIFVGDDGQTPPDERDILRWEIRPLLKRLGIYYEGFGWHALKRANVSWRQSLGGATPLEAMKAAGHTKVDTTMLYTLTDAERECEQVAKLYSAVMGISTGTKQ
jgi:integrase